jgi:hypothetical protein
MVNTTCRICQSKSTCELDFDTELTIVSTPKTISNILFKTNTKFIYFS